MLARLSAFVIWALVAATAVFWGLRLAVHPAATPAHTVASADNSAGRADLTRLLGAPPVEATVAAATPEASSRFRLLGVMAPKRTRSDAPSHGGVALIAVDGKPARAFAVGAHLDGDLVLRSVSLRTASIGTAQGPQTVLLEIPPFAAPATGTLPPVGTAAPVPVAPAAVPPATPSPVVAPAAAAPPVPLPRDASSVTQ
jgi:general secretion pathway protein C